MNDLFELCCLHSKGAILAQIVETNLGNKMDSNSKNVIRVHKFDIL